MRAFKALQFSKLNGKWRQKHQTPITSATHTKANHSFIVFNAHQLPINN